MAEPCAGTAAEPGHAREAPAAGDASDEAGNRPGAARGTRAGDVALAAMVLLLAVQDLVTVSRLTPEQLGPLLLLRGPSALVVGIVLALGQIATVLVRRRRPRTAYLAHAGLATVQMLSIGAYAAFVWPILAFSVARTPRFARGPRAAVSITLPLLVSLGFLLLVPMTYGGPTAGFILFFPTAWQEVPLVIAGAVAGRWTRIAAERADRERAVIGRARRASALRAERVRIADEVGGGVLAGLRSLVAHIEQLAVRPPAASDLQEIRDRARSVLAAMRRALGVLRAPGSVDPVAPEPDRRCATPPQRRPPLPDHAGLAVLAAFAVPALAVGLLIADVPPAREPSGLLHLLRLPLGSLLPLLVVAIQLAAVGWWRTAPVTALLVSGAGSFTAGALDVSNLFAEGTWTLLVWGAATRAPMLLSGAAVVISTLVVLAGSILHGSWERLDTTPPQVLPSYIAVAPLWLTGALVRRERRARDARAEAADRDAVTGERLRVARDLHDVVAHHVSAVAVQAGAARMAADSGDTDARAGAVAHIVESGRRIAEALPQLEGLTPDRSPAALDADGVAAVVAPSRAAGLPVTVVVDGDPPAEPGDADVFARHLLTESLTNVLRHAGPTPTRVHVTHRPSEVVVEVSDDGPVAGHRPDATGSGLGLVGMRERVALLGGDLGAGPAHTGWTVRAVLPRAAPAATEPAGLVPADEHAAFPISSSSPIRSDTRES
ncbi:sensor histidine kinase [Pseudonocardia phyllosphaerae]|uniref:sensor histidine kinase n=1 Tax=Pseudonocardia phyllosphaerae TaxID=3390502 RepID=UPI003978EAA6